MIKPDVIFALMTSFHKQGKSLYSSFLPLVLDCIQKINDEYIAIDKVQKKYNEIYGVKLPQNVIKRILIVGKNNGYITIDKEIIKPTEKINDINITDAQKKYLMEHEHIINNFISYVKSRKGFEIKLEEAENAMRNFMEENVYNLIKNALFRTNLEIKTSGGQELKIAFGQYLRNIVETSNETSLLYISDIAKGLMLQNAVYLPNEERIERKFSDTYLIFDTPIMLSFLGYAGSMLEIPIKELIKMAVQAKAKLGVFDFTISEITSILKDCSDRIRNNSRNKHGKTYEYFIEKNYTYEQIIVFLNNLEADIRKNNIDILRKPEYFDEYLVDEVRLESIIDKHIKYRNQAAKQRDTDSIATTFNLRKNANSLFLEEAKSIFITSNFGLVKASREYFSDKKLHIDVVMTDFYITNVLWVKNPIKSPDLPLKRIIADIYSALRPSDAVWNAFISEVDNMEDSGDLTYSDVIALRTANNLSDKLFEAEENGVTSFTPSSIKEILERINSEKRNDFKQEEINKLEGKSMTIAKKTTTIFFIIIFICLLAYNIIQIYEPLKKQVLNEIFTIYNIFSFIFLIFVMFNIICGTTINIIRRRIEKLIQKVIFYLFKKIIE
jgi:hypothetical protein